MVAPVVGVVVTPSASRSQEPGGVDVGAAHRQAWSAGRRAAGAAAGDEQPTAARRCRRRRSGADGPGRGARRQLGVDPVDGGLVGLAAGPHGHAARAPAGRSSTRGRRARRPARPRDRRRLPGPSQPPGRRPPARCRRPRRARPSRARSAARDEAGGPAVHAAHVPHQVAHRPLRAGRHGGVGVGLAPRPPPCARPLPRSASMWAGTSTGRSPTELTRAGRSRRRGCRWPRCPAPGADWPRSRGWAG